MFKGLSVFFETYSITAENAKNDVLRPIDVSCTIEDSMARVRDLLIRFRFHGFVEDKNFKELFATNDKFEVTASFIKLANGGTRIGASVFSPKKRTKKVLIQLMQELSKEFRNEII